MVYNNELIGTAYLYYDATSSTTSSHFVINSLNLSTASVQGLYQVGSQSAWTRGRVHDSHPQRMAGGFGGIRT